MSANIHPPRIKPAIHTVLYLHIRHLPYNRVHSADPLEFSASIAIVNLLLEGYGRSMLPRFIVERELERGSLAALDIKEKVPGLWSQLYYNSDKWLNPAMTAFIEYVKASFCS